MNKIIIAVLGGLLFSFNVYAAGFDAETKRILSEGTVNELTKAK